MRAVQCGAITISAAVRVHCSWVVGVSMVIARAVYVALLRLNLRLGWGSGRVSVAKCVFDRPLTCRFRPNADKQATQVTQGFDSYLHFAFQVINSCKPMILKTIQITTSSGAAHAASARANNDAIIT